LHDVNSDGTIEKNEAEKLWCVFKPQHPDQDKVFEDWFKYVDINRDGKITRDEFRRKGKQRLNDIRRNSAFLLED